MSDFELIPAAVFSPTQCILCHGGGPVVDTKVGVPGTQYGRVYICELCAGQIARAVGWVDPGAHAALQETHLRALESVAELERSLEETQDRWAELIAPRLPEGEPVEEGVA